MIIKSSKDARFLLGNFSTVAKHDGEKYYLTFRDKDRGGNLTLMIYPNGTITTHGKGETYCDPREQEINENKARTVIYKHRKAINEILRGI